MKPTIIMGGGLAGISLAHFLKTPSLVLEGEKEIGGLCRSFPFHGVYHDVGPHILFSKDKRALSELLSVVETNQLKRSNKIFHKGRLIKYPFENELSALEPAERDYCLSEFLSNPYRDYEAKTMLQFYLKIFGEGITRLYLEPYNRKIWKFDPAFMDTQMVERIPRPPDEDIVKSASGESTEGYLHQLYFNYPKSGGIAGVISGFAGRLGEKSEIITSAKIKRISRSNGTWKVETERGVFEAERLVNCLPLHELFRCLEAPPEIRSALAALKYNSIHIVLAKAKKDFLGENFALNFASPDLIFHRLTKLGFLGESYRPASGSVIMAEVTFRPGSPLSAVGEEEIAARVRNGLESLGLVEGIEDVSVKTFRYAYVIYDLHHRKNADSVLGYLKNEGINCCGRFAEFEYLNMDAVLNRSMALAEKMG